MPSSDTLTGSRGETWVRDSLSELITLSTLALTTDSATDLLPADAIIESVVTRINTAIAGGSNAKGTITLTGQPTVGVKAQGTITFDGAGDTDLPGIGVKAQGTMSLAGVPSVGVKAQGTMTLTGLPKKITAAQGTITFPTDALVPIADETFVIGSQTFVWKASRSTAGEVKLGATGSDCTENIQAAVNADMATVTATLGVGDTVIITAVTPGTSGNSITFTESSTNMTVDGSGTLGGTTLGAAAETFRVGAQTFTWVTTRAGVGEVTLGASAAACVTNIVAAITSDLASAVSAADGAGDTVTITAVDYGTAGNAIVLTEASSNLTVDGAGTLGTTTAGVDPDTFTVNAQTFTWKDVRVAAGDVAIGASAAECVTNIVTAVAADVPSVTAVDGAGDTVVITYNTVGTAGNAIVFTESSNNLTIDGAGTLGATTLGVAADTFRIDAQVFTWVESRSGVGQVTLGASKAECVTNVLAAIAADLVTVTGTGGTGTVIVTASAYGTDGNSIVFTESSGNMIVDGAGTLGTTTAGVATDTFAIDSQTFTIKTARAVTGDVALGGTTAATCTNIIAAINADLATVVAAQGAGTTVTVTAVVDGEDGNSITFTESLTNATMNGGGTLGGSTGALTTGYQVGDATSAARFAGTSSTLTVGATQVCLAHRQGGVSTDATGPVQSAAAKVRITAVGAPPDRGSVWVTVNYSRFTAPML